MKKFQRKTEMNQIESTKLAGYLRKIEFIKVDFKLKSGKIFLSFLPENTIKLIRFIIFVSVSIF